MKSLTILFLFFTLSSFSLTNALNSDGLSLLALKSAITSDPFSSLATWSENDPTPCNWDGVYCTRDRVTNLSLSNKSLTGYIPSELGALLSLRHLSLSKNNFSSSIPSHLFNATSLISLDLSHNSLSGSIPTEIVKLKNSLAELDLSGNLLSGSLPFELIELTRIVGTLNLSFNSFSGEVPASYGRFPVRVSLDFRNNDLSGKIPEVGSLLNQGPSAFDGNPRLCGFPLKRLCSIAAQSVDVVSLNPEKEKPISPGNGGFVKEERGESGRRKIVSIIPLVSGLFAVVGGVLFVFLWVSWRKRGFKEGKIGKVSEEGVRVVREEDEKGQNGKFVVVGEDGFGLELEDLLRASAYVVGKGRSGIVYKVVVVGGGKGLAVVVPMVVAVRRLSEGDDVTWRIKEFEYEVEAIGRIHHPNILPLRAYYYANDEKLLVSDFITNGSLYTALHDGGPSNDLQPLSWSSRLNIAQGIAKGLLHIHECSPRKYIHSDLKSSKVLLDEDFHPYISGFGLNRLVPGPSKLSNPDPNHPVLMGSKILKPSFVPYCAPEVWSGGKLTQKCDVYSFGLVLMELLTGRVPDIEPENGELGLESHVRKVFSEEKPLTEILDPALLHEVYAKKQVLAMFHIALSCTELNPEMRPKMRTVSENLDCLGFQ